LHKFFAKSLFIGKNVVFLTHCHSTNELAKTMVKSSGLSNGSILITDFQENGRGQQGNIWVSEKGKNLLFTIVIKPVDFVPNKQYLLNVLTAAAIHKTLSKLMPSTKVEIKWPNDIFVNDQKIAGILIETSISNGRLETVYCGIGLNVNQGHFSLNTATSMYLESGDAFDRDTVLETIILEMESGFELLDSNKDELLAYYHANMRWNSELHSYMIDGAQTEGVIKGIDNHGKLIMEVSGQLRHFALKEITFLH
jgi:BirA family biotin operon repressor/biotin-[acetyl-CoA-carboxylase] ligase